MGHARIVAVVFVLTSGCAWRHVPPSFGVSVPTAHRRLTDWRCLQVVGRPDRPGSQFRIVDRALRVSWGDGGPSPKWSPCQWK